MTTNPLPYLAYSWHIILCVFCNGQPVPHTMSKRTRKTRRSVCNRRFEDQVQCITLVQLHQLSTIAVTAPCYGARPLMGDCRFKVSLPRLYSVDAIGRALCTEPD